MSSNNHKVPMSELCKDALEHYIKLSNNSCDYNSLIPKAIEFYRLMHTPSNFRIEDYEPVYYNHIAKKYLTKLSDNIELWQCTECPYLFIKENNVFREPNPEDFEVS